VSCSRTYDEAICFAVDESLNVYVSTDKNPTLSGSWAYSEEIETLCPGEEEPSKEESRGYTSMSEIAKGEKETIEGNCNESVSADSVEVPKFKEDEKGETICPPEIEESDATVKFPVYEISQSGEFDVCNNLKNLWDHAHSVGAKESCTSDKEIVKVGCACVDITEEKDTIGDRFSLTADLEGTASIPSRQGGDPREVGLTGSFTWNAGGGQGEIRINFNPGIENVPAINVYTDLIAPNPSGVFPVVWTHCSSKKCMTAGGTVNLSNQNCDITASMNVASLSEDCPGSTPGYTFGQLWSLECITATSKSACGNLVASVMKLSDGLSTMNRASNLNNWIQVLEQGNYDLFCGSFSGYCTYSGEGEDVTVTVDDDKWARDNAIDLKDPSGEPLECGQEGYASLANCVQGMMGCLEAIATDIESANNSGDCNCGDYNITASATGTIEIPENLKGLCVFEVKPADYVYSCEEINGEPMQTTFKVGDTLSECD
jgi:hypothetical protein